MNYLEWGSEVSEDRLSNREVGKIKKWMMEKERDDRRYNIVIKGIKVEEGKEGKVWVQEFLKERLKVECRIDKYWVSGAVIVAKIENEEKKKEITANKNRLKGERVFIKNDLSWEERFRKRYIDGQKKKEIKKRI